MGFTLFNPSHALHFYKPAIRDAFGERAVHGVINKTYSVTHLNVTGWRS
jgi:hypothetical protein